MHADSMLYCVCGEKLEYKTYNFHFRADAGGEDGSIYLQALARYLQQEYMRRPLDKILKMVRQHMIRKVQVIIHLCYCIYLILHFIQSNNTT